jgi:hypothetical protein
VAASTTPAPRSARSAGGHQYDIHRAVNGAGSRAVGDYGSRRTCSRWATRPVDLSNRRTAGCAIQPVSLSPPGRDSGVPSVGCFRPRSHRRWRPARSRHRRTAHVRHADCRLWSPHSAPSRMPDRSPTTVVPTFRGRQVGPTLSCPNRRRVRVAPVSRPAGEPPTAVTAPAESLARRSRSRVGRTGGCPPHTVGYTDVNIRYPGVPTVLTRL